MRDERSSSCASANRPGPFAPPGGSAAPRPRIWPRAAGLGFVAAVPYLAIAGGMRCDCTQTTSAYHIFAADAMLHGQLHLRDEVLEEHARKAVDRAWATAQELQHARGETWSQERLNNYLRLSVVHDLAIHDDRAYAYWAPLTPALMVPWVAAFGPQASDRLINALLGAANVALAYWMFRNVDRSGLRRMSEPCCVAMSILLAFGTVHFWLSCGGCVWFAVQIATLTPLLLSVIALTARRNSPGTYAVSGALFGAAILGRNIVLLLGAFFLIVIWIRQRHEREPAARRFLACSLAFGLPLVAAGLTQMAYNYARFDDALEGGLAVQIRTGGEPRFARDFERYGIFSPAYFVRNLKYYLWNWNFPVRNGLRTFDPEGNSMFLVTPPLLFLFVAWRRRDAFTLALLCGGIPLIAALLFYIATGYMQFGNRYLLDAMPLLLLLAATGMNGRLSFTGFVLIVAAVAMNTFGVVRFYPNLTGPLADWLSPLTLAAAAMAAIGIGALIRRMRASDAAAAWTTERTRDLDNA